MTSVLPTIDSWLRDLAVLRIGAAGERTSDSYPLASGSAQVMDNSCEERVKELEEQLAREKAKNQLFADEITRLKNVVETSQTETEREEEYLVNQMIKRVNRLKKEKEELAIKVEQEEEYLTNTLQKKFQQLQKEKVDLELQLEQEEEFIVNKLHKQLDDILAEKRKVEHRLEEEHRAHAERLRQMEAKLKEMDAERERANSELARLHDANLVLSQKMEREKQQRLEAKKESAELMQAMEEISESGFNAAVAKIDRSMELVDPMTPRSRSGSNALQRSVSVEIPMAALARSRSNSLQRSGSLDRTTGLLSSGLFNISPSSSFMTQSGSYPALNQSGTLLHQSASFGGVSSHSSLDLKASGSFERSGSSSTGSADDRILLQRSASLDRSGSIPNLASGRSERSESSQSSRDGRDRSGSVSSAGSGYVSPSGSFHNGSPAPSLVTASFSMPLYATPGVPIYHAQRSSSIASLSTSPAKAQALVTPPRSPKMGQSPQLARRGPSAPGVVGFQSAITACSSGSSSGSVSPGSSPSESGSVELTGSATSGRHRNRSISLPSPRLAAPGPISPGARARAPAKVLKDAYVRKKTGNIWAMHFCKLLSSNELHFMGDAYAGSMDERPLEIVDLDTVADIASSTKLNRSAPATANEPFAVIELRCNRESGESHFLGFDNADAMQEWASLLRDLVTPAK